MQQPQVTHRHRLFRRLHALETDPHFLAELRHPIHKAPFT
jgi:hypothetical protein